MDDIQKLDSTFSKYSIDSSKWSNGLELCKNIVSSGRPLPLSGYVFLVTAVSGRISEKHRGQLFHHILALAAGDHTSLDEASHRVFEWQMRYIEDDFSRFAYKQLLDATRPASSKLDESQVSGVHNEIIAAANAGSFEHCWARINEYNGTPGSVIFPVRRVLEMMLRDDTGVDNMAIIDLLKQRQKKDVKDPIKCETYLLAFSRAAREFDYPAMRELWYMRIHSLLSTLSEGTLWNALYCASDAGDVKIVKGVSSELVRRQSTGELDSNVQDAISRAAAESLLNVAIIPTDSLQDVARKCATVLEMCPDLEPGRIPNLKTFISKVGSTGDPAAQVDVIRQQCAGFDNAVRLFIANAYMETLIAHSWSTAALYAYRRFIVEGFLESPNQESFKILVQAAMFIRNAKKLTYTIYNEMVQTYGIQPTSGIMERIVMCQLTGRAHDSVLYFIAEARQRGIHLLSGTVSGVRKTLKDERRLLKILDDPSFPGDEPWSFISDLRLQGGSTNKLGYRSYDAKRDISNTRSFLNGWDLEKRDVRIATKA
jgi:hypothetical protein